MKRKIIAVTACAKEILEVPVNAPIKDAEKVINDALKLIDTK